MQPSEAPRLYRMVRKAIDLVYPKMKMEGVENLPEEACIIVGNHAHANGPIISEVRLPFAHYTWCIAQMMNRSEVCEYAYADFWSKKPKSIRWLFRIISKIIPLPASYLLSNARTIPVYRDSRCIVTFRKTMEKLDEGASMVIFPEHEVPYNNIVWEFEDRFIDIAHMYYKRTGKCLSFVPMYLAPKLRKIVFGAPIRFCPDVPMAEERERICRELMQTVTRLATAQPVHTVVPYPNMAGKYYPKSLPLEEHHHAQEI